MGVRPPLFGLSPPSARDQIEGAATELLILTVAGAEGRQAPRKHAWGAMATSFPS
jgi:hypothetical protein